MLNPFTAASDKMISDNDKRIQAEVESEYAFQRDIARQEADAEREAESREQRMANDDWALDCNSRG